jgi:glycosyltransferase involved in cell wall biosynthesis
VLVSVIIPSYNVQDYITECIDSVLAQTYSPIEIICVDNNSTDNTVEIIKRYTSKYDNITLIYEERKGAPYARNKGLSVAKGEWIQFLDADDILLPNKIENQLSLVSHNTGFVCGAYIRKGVNGDEEKVFIDENSDDKFFSLISNKLGITSSNIFRTSDVININGWNESMKSSQEMDLMFRIIKNNVSFERDRSFLTIVRDRPSGRISQRNPSDKWQTYFDVRLNLVKWLKTHEKEHFRQFKSVYLSFLVSTALIYISYTSINITRFVDNLNKVFGKTKLLPIAGLNSMKAKIINVFGLKFFLNIMQFFYKLAK